MDVALRLYEDADLDACRDLWRELTQRHRDIYDDPSIGGDDPGRAFDAFLEKRPARVWVAEREGEVVGLAGLLIDGEEGEVDPMVVRGELRSQGVGTMMLEVAIEEARRLGVRTLSVRPVARNVEAIGLYHRIGFRALGQIDMVMELRDERQWRPGAELHGLDFGY